MARAEGSGRKTGLGIEPSSASVEELNGFAARERPSLFRRSYVQLFCCTDV
jgi:hypothetical protein